MIILICILILALITVTAMQPEKSTFSTFELERRSRHGRHDAKQSLRREAFRGDILSLQRIVMVFLVVMITIALVAAIGWGGGVTLALTVVVFYGAVARIGFIQRLSGKLYRIIEPSLLKFTEAVPWFFAAIRWSYSDNTHPQLGSREELEHLVHESNDVLSTQEKDLIIHGLRFADKEVRSIMTPKSMIDSIKSGEFLGPLVLSELHGLGHSRLPVITDDIDHVVGVLHLKDLLTLDDKKTVTAEKAMEARVFYINEHDSLEHALAAFLKTRHHLFIVVNEFRETVGLLTIEDVIETLLGRKIIDEDDIHDDVRAVAAHNPRRNNRPANGQDV